MNSAILKAIKDWCTGKFQAKGDYLTEVPEGYATKAELDKVLDEMTMTYEEALAILNKEDGETEG